ncbi:MAG: exo-beta-N-acetylmuramidase NamZ domain-containing protein [Flavisolibacter sp.]
MKHILTILVCSIWLSASSQGTAHKKITGTDEKIIPGAERLDAYVPLLKGKKIGVFANQTSMVGPSHLVDTLQKLGITIKAIFGPEHGFRGTADAGEKVGTYIDEKTGIKVISLYGSKRRPSPEDLQDIDILVFDIQDVGVRFYTFISSLEEFINAALEYGKPLLILDRPNPNGFYVDGPVLQPKFKSFVGMQPVPVVYGMTIGEYAMMLGGEKWLSEKANARYQYYQRAKNSPPDTSFHFLVIKCLHYTHNSRYTLPVKPSPNLPEIQSIYWYPSTCYFEGTTLSEGRGTDKPFEIFGHPSLPKNLYSFTPTSRDGAKDPKLKDKVCYGWNIGGTPDEVLKKVNNHIQLSYLLQAYKLFPDKDSFFIRPKKENPQPQDWGFNRLVGNGDLMQQMKEGKPEPEIRKSWEPALSEFKKIRKKYLLYADAVGL